MKRFREAVAQNEETAPDLESAAVRVIGGAATWPDGEYQILHEMVSRHGDVDDACPDGDDWVLWVSSAAEELAKRLRGELSLRSWPSEVRVEDEE